MGNIADIILLTIINESLYQTGQITGEEKEKIEKEIAGLELEIAF